MQALLHRIRAFACLSLLACVALGAFAGSAWAVAPTFTEPAPGTEFVSHVGEAIIPVKVRGTSLASLKPTALASLPNGLTLKPVEAGEAEWLIEGTPKEAKAKTKVTLEATSEGKTTTLSVEWTVQPEALPSISPISSVASRQNKPATVTVSGERIEELKATGLPAGVSELTKVSPSEWKITATPTTLESAEVTLEPKNHEKVAGPSVKFKWTVEAAEQPATIETPREQVTTEGQEVALTFKGTNVAELAARGLPPQLNITTIHTNSFEIYGITTTPAPAGPVELEATNAEGAKTFVSFNWTVREAFPTVLPPADQTSTEGTAVAKVIVKGAHLFELDASGLPAGLTLSKVSETEWTITGTPTAAKGATTVTLSATNKEKRPVEGTPPAPVTFRWTVLAREAPKIETPSKPPPTGTVITPPFVSAGRLGTVPTQKLGKELFASFLCEVSNCRVTITGLVIAGKMRFKVVSKATPIPKGKKFKIPLRLSKKQRKLILTALKKRKKVTAALSASIASSVGQQLTKALTVTVKR